MYFLGLCVSLISLLLFYYMYFGIQLKWYEYVYGGAVIAGSSFLAGMGLYAIVQACRAVWLLGDYDIIVDSHRFGVLRVGSVLSKCFLVISITWSGYVASSVFGQSTFPSFELGHNVPVVVWVIATLLFIVCSFLLCQLPLHQRMVQYKQDRLLDLSRMLRNVYPKVEQELTEEARANVAFLEDQREKVRLLPEWPFNVRSLVNVLGSAVAILLPALVDIGLSIAAQAAVRLGSDS